MSSVDMLLQLKVVGSSFGRRSWWVWVISWSMADV